MFTPLNQVIALNKTLQSVYNSAYANAEKNQWANEVANQVEGAGISDIREFLVEDLKIRVGNGIEYSDLRTASMAITHAQAGGGFRVRDRDFKAQNAMQIKTDAAAGLGTQSKLLGQKLLLGLINSATALAYDGITFWNANHFVNYKDASQGLFSNTAAAMDLTAQNIAMAASQIESRVMADGTPRMITSKWLLHSPALKYQAQQALNASFIAEVKGANLAPTDNVMAKKSAWNITPIQVPGLAQVGGKEQWIVAGEVEGGGTFARPFGISTLIPTTLTNFDGISQAHLAIMQELEYLVTGDLAAYLGHPFLAFRGIVS